MAVAVLTVVAGCADELVIPTRLDVPDEARVPSGDQPGIYSRGDRPTPPKTQEEVDEDIRDLEALREQIRQP